MSVLFIGIRFRSVLFTYITSNQLLLIFFVDDGSPWENILATKATSLLQAKPKKFTPTSTQTKLLGASLAQPTALLTRQVPTFKKNV